ncbi:MAG: DUF4296 domain-containing protein [Bacteroidetes bacterium]|nr:DUF4296 domain-containing protein [Bacteroidota bacterium]
MLRQVLNIIPIIFFIAFAGCKDNSIKIPPHIITQDTAIVLFTELQIMEALIIQGSLKQKDSLFTIDAYKTQLLKKIGLSTERFEENYNFYLNQPELLDKIYTEVLNEISRKKAAVESEKKRQDSRSNHNTKYFPSNIPNSTSAFEPQVEPTTEIRIPLPSIDY